MVNKKSSVFIAAIVALLCFLSVVYVSSCTKAGNGATCEGVVCENGGYCLTDTVTTNGNKQLTSHCVCPSGFEGANCATVSANKYLGSWSVVQTVIGSDSAKTIGTDSLYSVLLYASATPTTFMIYNLCGDKNYNDIICSIDSINTSNFTIDSLSAFHMIFDHFKLTQNASGVIVSGTSITITKLCIRRLNYNVNWQNDTLSLVMKPQ